MGSSLSNSQLREYRDVFGFDYHSTDPGLKIPALDLYAKFKKRSHNATWFLLSPTATPPIIASDGPEEFLYRVQDTFERQFFLMIESRYHRKRMYDEDHDPSCVSLFECLSLMPGFSVKAHRSLQKERIKYLSCSGYAFRKEEWMRTRDCTSCSFAYKMIPFLQHSHDID